MTAGAACLSTLVLLASVPATAPPDAHPPADAKLATPQQLQAPQPASAQRSVRRGAGPIRRVETKQPAVAITFDACATSKQSNGFDRAVYEIVKREGIPATIFVSGRWVDFHGDEMAELAKDPLLLFGDHSYGHPHMQRLTQARMVQEFEQTEAALSRYGKKSVAFRPPFGEWNRRLIEVARDRGLPTVTWDVVSGDPSIRTTKEGMIRNVLAKARAGSIVIFHINGRGRKTAEALPDILRGLRDRGLRFVSLPDLLAEAPAPQPSSP
jgi:peptidoglycan/xylan/chitin deacetylase (PgdA/CDA1 family)